MKKSNILKGNIRNTSQLNGISDESYTALAPVQRKTLQFLRSYIAENGFAPTLQVIADNIGVKSPSTAYFHLERLIKKGYLKRDAQGGYQLVVRDRPQLSSTSVKLAGVIAAGQPIEALEDASFVEIPPSMISGRGEVYCLEVSGDSMIDAHICDGDLVVIRKQSNADNGDIVVALLPDGSATLKYFKRLKNRKIMLIPANKSMEPILVDDLTVQGKVIGVIREL